jgi:hypothetical protein
MESAFLNEKLIYLERERWELIENGMSEIQVIDSLEFRYRVLARKDLFRCSCCSDPVRMVLREGCFHFRHAADSHCVGGHNGKIYREKEKLERVELHRVGRAILREILDGNTKGHGIRLQDGYTFKKRLAMVPDFLLTFPVEDKVWAIDYLTGLKGNSTTYIHQVEKRKQYYEKQGWKPFFFLHDSWLALDPNEPFFVGLSSSEVTISHPSKQDKRWGDWLQRLIQKVEDLWISRNSRLRNHYPFLVQHITYINPQHRNATIIRYVPSTFNYFHFMIGEPIHVSLEELLSIHVDSHSFDPAKEDQKASQTFLHALGQQHQKIQQEKELERKRKEEQEQKRREAAEAQQKRRWALETRDRYVKPMSGQAPRSIHPIESGDKVTIYRIDKIQSIVDEAVACGLMEEEYWRSCILVCQNYLNQYEKEGCLYSSERLELIKHTNDIKKELLRTRK